MNYGFVTDIKKLDNRVVIKSSSAIPECHISINFRNKYLPHAYKIVSPTFQNLKSKTIASITYFRDNNPNIDVLPYRVAIKTTNGETHYVSIQKIIDESCDIDYDENNTFNSIDSDVFLTIRYCKEENSQEYLTLEEYYDNFTCDDQETGEFMEDIPGQNEPMDNTQDYFAYF